MCIMKKLPLIAILIIFALISSSVYSVTGQIENISGDRYYDSVRKLFKNAKQSIDIVMYYINLERMGPESKVFQLVNDLVEAKNRGVAVKVILDQNVSFREKMESGRKYEPEHKNKKVFEYLKKNGVDVMYDDVQIYTHAKSIVVDKKWVVVGSANWSRSSLLRNNEINVLIQSKELATEMMEEFEKIALDYESIDIEPQEYITFQQDIMIDVLSDLVTHNNDYTWYVYMYLVGNCEPDVEIDIDYDVLADYMGIKENFAVKKYREYIRNALRALDERYKVLKFNKEPEPMQNAKVMLKKYNDKKKRYFRIPEKFWDYGWDKRLSLAGKYCYFVNLIEGGVNRAWSRGLPNLSNKYKGGKERYSNGMAELRSWDLLRIQYGRTDFGKGYDKRFPNIYRLKTLYKIEDWEKEYNKLIEKYGEGRVEQAVEYAKIVFMERNLYDIEDIIKMTDEYGKKKVDYAFDKVKGKAKDNPKRSIAYVKGILRQGART